MESRFRVLFLIVAMISLSGCAATKNLFGFGNKEAPPPSAQAPGQVIDPEVDRREIKEPKIDREDFEVGAYAGIMSIEDFGSNVSYGLRIAYHITEGFFMEATVGQSDGGLTSFEVLSGGARLITDSERTLTYYNLNVGYNILPGEVFLGEGRAYNTNLYLIAGLGSTTFAGDDRFTVNFGAGYRFLLNDSVALHLDFRDHLFDIDLLGEEKTAHNLESHLGVTVFF
ncbi:MAG: outer membrane beta-barrel domain-containing protein [Gammaproteobacteria bacterium]|jgi:outer membrane beta-barrel protein|nr:outer membrane beta-barrel domain-containing protein [Gammaproteobacteria bacterium]MDH3778165.1 outer membrane beta-barrel domain-containing protein [Gammaproteobacteria bacterium]MDH3812061.1 outer membrane beta-barrel domain-containing protein [Gammaproteobacteria bacterium]